MRYVFLFAILLVLAPGYLLAQGPTTARVSTVNSTAAALAGGATFTGEWEDASNFSAVTIVVLSDQAGTLYLDFSPDRTNADSSLSYATLASQNEVHRVTVTRKYARVRFVNGATPQTYMRLQTIFGAQTMLNSNLNSTIQQDADAIVVRVRDFEFDIAAGRAQGFSVVNKFGDNPDVDAGTVPEDVWGGDGVYPGFPTGAAETLQVFSASANDAAAGTGARTVRVIGLDGSHNVIQETVTLNGVTPVVTTQSFLRVHTASVQTSGSSNTAFNAGAITIRHSATTANVFLLISAGTNQSYCSCYTVPAGYTAYLRYLTGAVRSGATNAVDTSIWLRSPTTAPRLRRPFTIPSSSPYKEDIYGGLIFSEKTDIILRVTATTGSNLDVNSGYDLILVQN